MDPRSSNGLKSNEQLDIKQPEMKFRSYIFILFEENRA